MALKDAGQRAHDALIETVRDVRAYADSDLSKHVIDMLDALAASYCLDLIEVTPDGLSRLQAALKQVSLLRDIFANDGVNIPKI